MSSHASDGTENQGTSSPPYPSHITNSRGLYRHLIILHEWVISQQGELRLLLDVLANEEEKRGKYPIAAAVRKTMHAMVEPDNLSAETVWDNVSVWDKYGTLMYLRQIRESWDYILREHEDAWDSKLAVRKRCSLVQMAQHILGEAFVSPEVREMRDQKAQDEAVRQMKAYRKALKKLMVPKEMQEDEDETPAADAQEDQNDVDWFDVDTEE